jgi:hypothetical protein
MTQEKAKPVKYIATDELIKFMKEHSHDDFNSPTSMASAAKLSPATFARVMTKEAVAFTTAKAVWKFCTLHGWDKSFDDSFITTRNY